MRGGYPSQTLPIAGGQPPTPPGSVSPLHHDQRPALDSLKHHTPYRQPASALPLPVPPRLVPHTLRRRHTIQQYKRGAVLPTKPTDDQLHARQDAGRSPSPPLGGAAPRPSPSLRSTSPVACAAQAHRLPQPAVCANVNTCRRRRASTYSALRRRHRRETTTRRNMPPDRRCLRGAYPFSPMPQSWPAPPV